MDFFLTIAAVMACGAGLLLSVMNWYCLWRTLATRIYCSQIPFIGGLLLYAGSSWLLSSDDSALACVSFLIDASYPSFVVGLFYKG